VAERMIIHSGYLVVLTIIDLIATRISVYFEKAVAVLIFLIVKWF